MSYLLLFLFCRVEATIRNFINRLFDKSSTFDNRRFCINVVFKQRAVIKRTNLKLKNIFYMKTNSNNTALGYTKEPLKSENMSNVIAIGYEQKSEIKLEPHQLEFIEKCKKEGKLGCILTIDNQQNYVSFYNIKPIVGNAR